MNLEFTRPNAPGALALPAEAEPSVQDTDEGDAAASLHPDLWRAMVSETGGACWYMDLESLTILRVPLSDGRPGAPVAEHPERYLVVPTLQTDKQRGHARKVLTEHVGAEQALALTVGEPWLRHFHEHATPELRQILSDARRAWVIGEVRAWLREHDIQEQRFVRAGRAAPRELRPPARFPRTRQGALRDAVHQAVDRMTERELEALAIPARLLIDE